MDLLNNILGNAVGTLIAAGLIYFIGTRYAVAALEDWATARAVRVESGALVGPGHGQRVTLINDSNRSVTGVTGVWMSKSGDLTATPFTDQTVIDGVFTNGRLRAGEQASADVCNQRYVAVAWIGVTFQVADGGRGFLVKVFPKSGLQRYYSRAERPWGRWEFIRVSLFSIRWKALRTWRFVSRQRVE